jgi:hypothetical protein
MVKEKSVSTEEIIRHIYLKMIGVNQGDKTEFTDEELEFIKSLE